MKTERKIHLILDNYSVHKSQFIINIAQHLNINLIYLPPYSPHLNPIEQIWRIEKLEIKKYFIKSKEFLEEKVSEIYNQIVSKKSLTDKWYNNFITKVW